MEAFDAQRAARRLAEFIDDLSNWYVRRSRRRFWNGDASALATLHECLETLTRLLAPIAPFITERVWQALIVATDPHAPESVHLTSWPERHDHLFEETLSVDMALARRIVEVGRAARAGSGVKTRQPISRALISAPGWNSLPGEIRCEIAEELNVLRLGMVDEATAVIDVTVKPQFRALGKRFGSRTQQVANAVRAAEPREVADALAAAGTASFTVDGEEIMLGSEEIEVSQTPLAGWFVATEGAITVALDLEITPELRRAGIARDVVRLIQQARKDSGLHITDRIGVWWQASAETTEAVLEHAALIADEVLAVRLVNDEPPTVAHQHKDDQLGICFWLAKS